MQHFGCCVLVKNTHKEHNATAYIFIIKVATIGEVEFIFIVELSHLWHKSLKKVEGGLRTQSFLSFVPKCASYHMSEVGKVPNTASAPPPLVSGLLYCLKHPPLTQDLAIVPGPISAIFDGGGGGKRERVVMLWTLYQYLAQNLLKSIVLLLSKCFTLTIVDNIKSFLQLRKTYRAGPATLGSKVFPAVTKAGREFTIFLR